MNAETATEVTQVTSGEHDNFSPKWSPDGDYMVFVSNRSAKRARKIYNAKSGTYAGLTMRNATEFNLFATRPDGAGVVQLTSGDAMNVDPIWGKDGWIYFASNQSGNFDIWRLRPTGELIGKK
jgi:Tol biopolymer transport system component